MRKILVFLIIISTSSNVFTQPVNTLIGDVVMPPPDAAALGKYTDLPISQFTGVPSINIPIHTIQEGSLTAPISMSYHAGGIQVAEPASWAGTGWSLNAGGLITRTVLGLPDEHIWGYFNTGQNITGDVWDIIAAINGTQDSEPDIFSFNFLGYTGKFFCDALGNFHHVRNETDNIKIEFIGATNGGNLDGFKLTTPEGNVHYFGKYLTDVAVGDISVAGTDFERANWYLLRSESHDGIHWVDYNYEIDNYKYQTPSTCEHTKFINFYCSGGVSGFEGCHYPPSGDPHGGNTEFYIIAVEGKKLSSIQTSSNLEEVIFESTTEREDLYHLNQGKSLDAIEIHSGSTVCSRFNFSYSYFFDNNLSNIPTNSFAKRLRLNSIQQTDCNGTLPTIPPYTFTYDGDYLPNRLSKAIDHWGYYNEAHSNDNLTVNCPETSVSTWDGLEYTYGEAERNSKESAMLLGMLNRIDYPTGGYHEFIYEANRVNFDDLLQIGGDPVDYLLKDYYDLIFNTYTCTFFTPEHCCGENETVLTKTFTQTDIDYGELKMQLHHVDVPEDYTGYDQCQEKPAQYFLSFTPTPVSPGDLPVANYFFSSSSDPSEFLTPVYREENLSNFSGLEAGVEYEIKLKSVHGDAVLSFYSIDYNPEEGETPGIIVGGVRVQKITINDGGGQSSPIIKEYKYVEEGNSLQSSGELISFPQYGGIAQSADGTKLVISFKPTSIVPLGSFEGYNMGYRHVEEIIPDNGKTSYAFTINPMSFTGEFPVAPVPPTPDNGKLEIQKVVSEGGAVLSKTDNYCYSPLVTTVPGVAFKVFARSGTTVLVLESDCYEYSVNFYPLQKVRYRLDRVENTLDGVNTYTIYDYSDIYNHEQPTKISQLNSDGQLYSTAYRYAQEDGNFDMVSKNMIAIPIEEKKLVGNAVIGGNYTYFVDGYPVANDEILEGDIRLPRSSTSSYTNGYPDNFTYMSFPTETYNWMSGGRLNTRSFEDWHWDYDYHLNTRLVSKIKDIDGQEVDYEYDQLGRLNKIIARDGNVTTDIIYHIGGGNNRITSTTTFTDDTPTQVKEEIFDGLGRMTKQIINGITKQEIIYDGAGRVSQDTYLPGSFTTYKYEPSPLNRVQRAIFPDLNYIETYYGGENNYYKVTTRNERGYRSSALTDILGRQYKNIDAEEGETKYEYDNRSNLIYIYPPSGSPYTYTYDIRNRMTSKLVPGSKIQIFRYDDLTDLMEYSIDANGNRMDYVYDVYGRQKELKHNKLGSWNPDDSNYYNNVTNHGSAGSMMIENIFGENNGSQINTGKVVATKAKILKSGPTSYAQTLFAYDTYGRVSQQKDFHHLGTDYYNFTNNLADWVLEERRTHTKAGNQIELITKRGYDNFGRELFYNTRVDGADALLAIGRSYNEKDQVVGKYYAGLDPFSALDYAKYKYNVRGWLTNINDVVYDLQEADECGELFDTGGDIIQVEQEVDVDGLLDWLCQEPDGTTIGGTDPCTPGDCFDEFYDYVVYSQHTASLTPDGYYVRVKLSSITLQGGNEVPLPNYPYYYDSQTSMNALESDLENWLDDNNYAYDDVIVSSTFHEIGTGKYYHNFVLQILGVIDDVVFEDIEETYRNNNILSSDPIPFYAHFNHGVPCNDHVPTENTKPQSVSLLDIRQHIISTNPATLTFPVIAYQTHMEDGTSRWIPKDALHLLTGSYVRGKRIHISSPLETLEARYENGTYANLNLLALYQELVGDLGVDIKDVEDESEEEECDEPSFDCTPEQQESQQESLAGIQNSICNMSASDFEFPLTVTFVQLCDGTTGYIPGEELLSELEGPYYILNQFDINADDLITILVTIKRPLFAMHFSKYQENGNIAELRWKVTDHSVKQYNFAYDGINRLTSANYGYHTVMSNAQGELIRNLVASEEYSVPSISYDPIGNITDLIRNGMVPGTTCLEPNEIDNLRYHYNDLGQVDNVEDNAPLGPRSYGFVPGSTTTIQYQYDDNGNMTHDAHKGLSNITYNFLNLPEDFGNMEVTYDATGRKWEKQSGNVITQYINGIEYKGSDIEAIYAPDGRLVFDGLNGGRAEFRAEYCHQDHLGNNRLVFCDFNNNGLIETSDDPATLENELEITQETHYYPFGLEHKGNWYATVAPDNNYLYNGKELNRDFDINLYEYGARWYDPAIGRWTSIDPLAESYYPYSPYNYVLGNPIRNWDPDGMKVENEYVKYRDANGDEQYKLVGTEGGNDYDVIYDGKMNEDGSVSYDDSEGEIVEVEIENTSGPGNMSLSAQEKNPTPGTREEHNRTPAVFRAIAALFGGQAAGSGVSTTLGFAKLSKPPRGKGAVPPSQRDPKRVYSKSEKAEMLKDQGGRCIQCGEKKTVDEVHGHHIKRHADGYPTTKENGAAVCHPCHKKLHSKE